jgi:hypothetical protein
LPEGTTWRSSACVGSSSKLMDCIAAISTKTSLTRFSFSLGMATHCICRWGDLKLRSKKTTLLPIVFRAFVIAPLNV